MYLFLCTAVNILLYAVLTQVYVGVMLLFASCLTESMIKVGDSSGIQISHLKDPKLDCSLWDSKVVHLESHICILTCIYSMFLFQYHIILIFYFTTPSGMGFISFVIHLDSSFTKEDRIVYDDLKPFFGFLPQSHAIQISSRRVKRFTSWTILKCTWTVESINGWIPEVGSIQEEWCMGCEFLKQ